MKDLYLSREFVPRIALTLEELVGESATEVLPVLQNLFLEELHLSATVQEAIEQFVAARGLADQAIAENEKRSSMSTNFQLSMIHQCSITRQFSIIRRFSMILPCSMILHCSMTDQYDQSSILVTFGAIYLTSRYPP